MGGGGATGGIPHPFPQSPSAVRGTHPFAFLQPLIHQRGCARGGHPGFNYQGCGGACSISLSGLLQPSFCGMENLGVVVSGHRLLHPQLLRGCVTLPDGDHPVCPPFHPSGRLDGLHRYSGSVPAGSGSPGTRPFLRFVSNGHVYQFKGLCFGLSTAPQVFSQVMAPVSAILHSMGIRIRRYLDDWLVQSSSRESLLQDLQVVLGVCHELGIVANPEKSNLIPSQVVQYLGVIINAQSFVASPSLESIPSRVRVVPHSAGDAFLVGSPDARGQTVHARPPTVPPPVLGSLGSVSSGGLVPGLPSGSPVVASPASSLPRCISPPGVSRPRLLVRRIGRRVGCSSRSPRRFRPLGRGRGASPYQRQGAASHPSRSPRLSVVSVKEEYRGLLRQRHCGGVPAQSGGHQVSLAEFHPSGSAIHTGLQQCPGGCSVSPSPASAFRVVPQHDSISVFESSVASTNRFVCHLSKLPLFGIFLALPRPSVGGHRCLSPVLGRSSGICLSSICHHSQSSCQTPRISGHGAHASGSALGSAP